MLFLCMYIILTDNHKLQIKTGMMYWGVLVPDMWTDKCVLGLITCQVFLNII